LICIITPEDYIVISWIVFCHFWNYGQEKSSIFAAFYKYSEE